MPVRARKNSLNPKICNFRIIIRIYFSPNLDHCKLPLSPLVWSTLSAVEAQTPEQLNPGALLLKPVGVEEVCNDLNQC